VGKGCKIHDPARGQRGEGDEEEVEAGKHDAMFSFLVLEWGKYSKGSSKTSRMLVESGL
jgi:hypothetical protein